MTVDRLSDTGRGWHLVVTAVALLVVVSAAAPLAAAAGGTTVSLVPADTSVDVGQTTTFEVVVDSADGGVGAAEFSVAVDDPSVAEITDVTVLGSGATNTDIAADGSSVDVEYAFRDTADTGSVTIAEVTVQGVSDGSTGVSLAPASGNDDVLVFDEGGTGYDVTGTNDATLDVVGDQPAPDPANFEVSNLQAPASVTQGDAIDVSATVENTGGETATKAVEFRVDTDGDDSIADESAVASQDVQLDAGASTTVEFTDIDTSGLSTGTVTHGVATPDDTATATITIEEPPEPAPETTVSLQPSDQTVTTGQAVTYDVVVDGVDGGVGAAEFSVAVDDTSVATITSATVLGSGSSEIDVADDGSSVDVEYAFRDTADTGSVTVAEVTVQGESAGTAGLTLAPSDGNDAVLVFDESGTGYDVTDTNGASVTVEAPPEPANFAVSNLSPTDVTVTQGDVVDVSATVENTGERTATQTVEFRVDGTALASQDVTLDPGASTTVTFEDVDTSGLDPGEYTHGVYTENDSATATLTVEDASLPPVGDFANAPSDPDDDGLYEDVNGDGAVDVVDVQALFANLESDTVQNNPENFDFNGDGTVDVVDVQKLFTEVN
ncbi:dockerin type I domain-containing protein [Halomicroarcula sp. S1AR25-4]|uniref:CARDB domain-containing protein n=1 Tax=Haloarcula sp. S1AR25-4 TaxID=2950538 RepID=UPI0028767901|nr:CARDB domain-containing protein [Halomicroarcula sp. S1AR25-4]MDS0279519.1 dockerin type I domain-containing protein [Halomicroarcula sp. S1AR25-4]